MAQDIFSIPVKTISGEETTLAPFKGKVLVIVNVASQCGLTPQYQGLEELEKKYKDRGFEILGFPCNQFGGQEPGTEGQIKTFCETHFGVSFPLFAKIEVNGEGTHPLYKFLKSKAPGLLGTEAIKWNFTKFIIDRQGNVVERVAPQSEPSTMVGSIEKLL